MPAATWAVPSPASKYGGAFTTPNAPTKDDSPLVQIAGPSQAASGMDKILHPNNPLFWAGAIIAGAVGLAAWSTTVRVGPVRGSVSLGDA